MVGRIPSLSWFCHVLLDLNACSVLIKCTSPPHYLSHYLPRRYKSWKFGYFPISGNLAYDKFGHIYDTARVLTTDDRFDLEAYNAYSPLILPATYAMTYLIALALSTCVIVHTVLYHGSSLLNGIKMWRMEPDDIEVPDWWYLSTSCVCFLLAVVVQVVEASNSICVHVCLGIA